MLEPRLAPGGGPGRVTQKNAYTHDCYEKRTRKMFGVRKKRFIPRITPLPSPEPSRALAR